MSAQKPQDDQEAEAPDEAEAVEVAEPTAGESLPGKNDEAVDDDPAPEPTSTQEGGEFIPAEVDQRVPHLTLEGERARIDVWLADTRYLISQIYHEHGGDRGEILAWLKAHL
jgi:hypothetical protein